MRVTIEFGPYNHRRYSRPWIAKVTEWPVGKQPALEFGALVGLTGEIEADIGDVIRSGQRDNRGNNTVSNWGIVTADGSVADATATEARNHWLSK